MAAARAKVVVVSIVGSLFIVAPFMFEAFVFGTGFVIKFFVPF